MGSCIYRPSVNVSEENLDACGEEIALIARTNSAVVAAANAGLAEGFCFKEFLTENGVDIENNSKT